MASHPAFNRTAPSAGIEVKRAALFIVLLTIMIAFVSGFIRIDTYHVIGISIGTNTHYCSAEITSHGPVASCEVAN